MPATTSRSGRATGRRTSGSCRPTGLDPDETDAVADRDELERAFRRLSVEQRAVFVLHHYLGLPLVEVAELLEIPAGTARSRLHYAIAELRDALTADAEPIAREDGSHDRRPLARTRRSVVDRSRPDPCAGARRRCGAPPHRTDTTGAGLQRPAEDPDHAQHRSRRQRPPPLACCWSAAPCSSSGGASRTSSARSISVAIRVANVECAGVVCRSDAAIGRPAALPDAPDSQLVAEAYVATPFAPGLFPVCMHPPQPRM